MIDIRSARIEDAADLVAIYAPYVEKTAITFETEVPTVEAFASRIEKTLEKFPYLVAVEEGALVGYAYASTYYARAAYDLKQKCRLSKPLQVELKRPWRSFPIWSQLKRALLLVMPMLQPTMPVRLTIGRWNYLSISSKMLEEKESAPCSMMPWKRN